jgi:hypothetical protein
VWSSERYATQIFVKLILKAPSHKYVIIQDGRAVVNPLLFAQLRPCGVSGMHILGHHYGHIPQLALQYREARRCYRDVDKGLDVAARFL